MEDCSDTNPWLVFHHSLLALQTYPDLRPVYTHNSLDRCRESAGPLQHMTAVYTQHGRQHVQTVGNTASPSPPPPPPHTHSPNCQPSLLTPLNGRSRVRRLLRSHQELHTYSPWMREMKIILHPVAFKVNTGADTCVITVAAFTCLVPQPAATLQCPDGSSLH